MGTIEVERKNGHYIKRCVGINSEGMLDYQLNGDTEVVGAIYIKLSENNRLNLAIKVNRESNFDTLSNVTLSIETSEIDSNRYIELYKESGMESDGLELISCIKSSKKIYEFNISKYFSEPTDETVYFSIKTHVDTLIRIRNTEVKISYVKQGQAFLNQKYVEGSAGRAINYKINTRNGEGIFAKSLVTLDGNLMPINLGLVFSNIKSASLWFEGMPYGWKTNYHQRVSPKSDGTIIYTDSSGFEHVFEKALNSNTVYFDVAGTGLILTINGDGTKVIDDGYKNYLQFNNYGYLERIRHGDEVNEIATVIEYDSSRRIKYICDGMDRTYTFTYNTSNIVVSGPGVQNITLTLSGHKLTTVKECGGRVSNYTYSNNYLYSAISDNGEKAVFEYNDIDRIISVKDYFNNGENNLTNERDVEYKFQATIITNHKGIKYQYIYNEDGECVGECEVTSDGNGNYISVKKSDFETVKNSVYKDSYYSYGSVAVRKDWSGSVPYIEKVGDISIGALRKYAVIFQYKIIGAYVDSDAQQSIRVYQGEELIYEYPLDPKVDYEKVESFTFEAPNDGDVCFRLHYTNVGEATLNYIKVYKHKTKVERNCINKNNSSEPTLTNILGTPWWSIFEWIVFSYYDNNSQQQQEISFKKMISEDIIENQKNHKINPSNHYIWYNKKRGLIVNAKNVKLLLAGTYYSIDDVEVAKIYETDNYSKCSFRDYKFTPCEYDLMYEYEYITYNGNIGHSRTLYNKDFLPIEHIDYNGVLSTTEYDSYGNVIKEVYGSMETTKTYTSDYKFLASETSYVGELEATTTYEFDSNTGNLIKVTEPNSNVITYTYNSNTNQLTKVSSTLGSNSNYNTINYTKDNMREALSNGMQGYRFTYDKYNMLSKVSAFRTGTESTFINFYNDINDSNDVSRTIFNDNYVEEIISDKYGNPIYKKYGSYGSANANELELYYGDKDVDSINDSYNPESPKLFKNSGSKLRKVIDNRTDNTEKFYYNDKGLLEKITNNTTKYVDEKLFEYDDMERVINEKITFGDTVIENNITYRESDVSNLSDVSSYATNISWKYASSSLVAEYFKNNTKSSLNMIIEDTVGTGNYSYKRVYEYATKTDSNTNRITPFVKKVTYKKLNSSIETSLGYIEYTYNNMGNITKIIDTVTNNTINYTYDNIGRLTREDNLKLGKTKMWTYDEYGNISSSKEGTYTLSSLTSATTYSYGYNSNFPNRLTNYSGNSVSYDVNGNMTNLGSYTFTWTRGRLLNSCTKAGMNYTFTYDARGLRTVKYHGAVDYTNYIYDSKKLISEHRVSGNDQFDLHYIYAGNEIIGFVYQNKNYYYIKNVQGDIIKLVDNFNNVVATYVYDAWGNHKVYNANGVENTSSSWIGNINPFRYRGYYYDVETGLFWCNSRYYNPEWGRWISPDSIEYLDPQSINGLNLYAYCMNDPVNMYDPSGCAPEWLGWVLTGVALVGLTALTVLSLGTAAPITGVAAGVIIGATCGAYAGAITSVVSQGISNGWDNISSWEVLKQTGIGTLSGAISGLGAGIGTTVLTGGIAQVTSGLLDGSIDSFSDGLVQFALGGMLSGLTYGLGKIVSNKFAASKISSVLGNSSKNSIINKRLAAAGFNNLKVGVDGMSGVVNYLYKYYGYQAISSIVSGIAGGGISFIGGIM